MQLIEICTGPTRLKPLVVATMRDLPVLDGFAFFRAASR
jgi:hypothetical protein